MSGGFVMVPDWLRKKKPSGNAYTIYITLGSFGTFKPGTGRYEECRPSLNRMVEESGLSLSVVKRALAELVDLGAAERIKRWNADGSSAPSMYRLIFGEVRGPEPEPVAPETDSPVPVEGGPGADSSLPADGPLGSPPADTNQEPSTKNQSTKKETSSSRASSSSSTPARKPRTKIDDEEAREKKIASRKRRERTSAKRKVMNRTGADEEQADALLDYFVDQYAAGNLDRYVDGLDDEDLATRLEEATWEIEAERVAERNRAEAADGIMRQVAKSYPDADLDDLRAAYIGALRQGHTGDAICDTLNATHDQRHRGDPIDDYIDAIEALGQPVAA